MLMLNRAFFSLQSNWIPTSSRSATSSLNAILDFVLYQWSASGGSRSRPRSATSPATWALLVVLRRRIGRLDGARDRVDDDPRRRRLGGRRRRRWSVWRPLDSALGRSFPAQVVSLGAALAAAIAVYFFGCRLLRVRELDAVLSLRSRLRRA